MSAPELIHTDSSSTTFLGGDEMRNDDLPSGHGGAHLEATTQTGVVDVVDSDIGALSRPGLVSDDKGSGAIAPSATLESDRDGSSPATGFDIPKLGAIRADIDGALLAGKDGYESIPSFTPRGSFNPPTTVLQKDTKKDTKKDAEDNKKSGGKK